MTGPAPVPCLGCGEPLDRTVTVHGLALHPTCDPLPVDPAAVVAEAVALVVSADADSPRSRQTVIGPSEIGHPCDRWVALKVAGVPAVNPREPSWAAIVGTATHALVGDAIARAEIARFTTDGPVSARWHVEERVTVGTVGGVPVSGSCDLFDGHTGTVVDFKVVSTTRAAALSKEPPAQYVTQVHLYGKGFEDAGQPVRWVSLAFIRRDGGDPAVWAAPYDRSVAEAAIARVDAIARSVEFVGVEPTAAALPATRHYCETCPFYVKGTDDPRACAGVPHATPPLAGLLN